MANNIRPVHPGEVLRGEMAELGLSARQLALALKVPTNRVTGVLNKQRAVTANTALRLARYFGTAPEFWLNLQSAYDLHLTRLALGVQVEQDVSPRAA